MDNFSSAKRLSSPAGNGARGQHSPSRRSLQPGLSLVELLIALSVLAILVSLAAPAMRTAFARHRVQGAAEELYSAVVLARSEAIKRSKRVTLCKGGPEGCAREGDWSQGWVLFVDEEEDAKLDPTDPMLMAHERLDQLRIAANAPVASYVSFTARGVPTLISGAFQAGTLILCAADSEQVEPKSIIVSKIGRVRIAHSRTEQCSP